jgi:acetyl esterase/lipase
LRSSLLTLAFYADARLVPSCDSDLPAETMRAFWSLYLPPSSPPDWSHPLVSPALASNAVLARLPKVWICEGNADLVRDEGLVLARRIREAKALAEADPAVRVKVYDGVSHGYTIQDAVRASVWRKAVAWRGR